MTEVFKLKPRVSSSMMVDVAAMSNVSEKELLEREERYGGQFNLFVETLEAVFTTMPESLHDAVVAEVKARKIRKEQLIFSTSDGLEVEIPSEIKMMMGELPFSRQYVEVGEDRNNPRIEIMAPLRMGKTTLAGVLHEQFQLLGVESEFWQEDFKGNPHWDKMARNPTSEIVKEFQKDFLNKDMDIIRQAGNSGITSIFEVNEVNDFGYALNNYMQGRMEEEEFAEYLSYFQYECFFEAHPAADLSILITASDGNYLNRALDNARIEEGGLEAKYYLTLKAIVEGLFERMDYTNRLVITTDNFDFSDNGDRQEVVAKEVLGALKQIGFSNLE